MIIIKKEVLVVLDIVWIHTVDVSDHVNNAHMRLMDKISHLFFQTATDIAILSLL